MTLDITIIIESDEATPTDQWKEVKCEIDNATPLYEEYSFPIETSDEEIRSEIEADLTAKGYTW